MLRWLRRTPESLVPVLLHVITLDNNEEGFYSWKHTYTRALDSLATKAWAFVSCGHGSLPDDIDGGYKLVDLAREK